MENFAGGRMVLPHKKKYLQSLQSEKIVRVQSKKSEHGGVCVGECYTFSVKPSSDQLNSFNLLVSLK